jgi:hypothetical protein
VAITAIPFTILPIGNPKAWGKVEVHFVGPRMASGVSDLFHLFYSIIKKSSTREKPSELLRARGSKGKKMLLINMFGSKDAFLSSIHKQRTLNQPLSYRYSHMRPSVSGAGFEVCLNSCST